MIDAKWWMSVTWHSGVGTSPRPATPHLIGASSPPRVCGLSTHLRVGRVVERDMLLQWSLWAVSVGPARSSGRRGGVESGSKRVGRWSLSKVSLINIVRYNSISYIMDQTQMSWRPKWQNTHWAR